MNPEYTIVLIIILILAGIILVWAGQLGTRSVTIPPASVTKEKLAVGSWSAPVAVQGSNRNSCMVYTFPPESAGDQVLIPGSPVNDPSIINLLAPEQYQGCLDDDQILLRLRERICQGTTQCRGDDGAVYLPGQKEQYYEECKAQKCNRYLGLIALNADSSDVSNALCLTTPHVVGQPVSLLPCDLTNPNQVLQIERYNSKKVKTRGNYMRVKDRVTGKCLTKSGGKVVLGECTTNGDGIEWALIPPIGACPTGYTLYNPKGTGAPMNTPEYKDNKFFPCYNASASADDKYKSFDKFSPQQLAHTTKLFQEPTNAYEMGLILGLTELTPMTPLVDGTIDVTTVGPIPAAVPADLMSSVTAQIYDYYLFDKLSTNRACKYPFYSVPGITNSC